MLNQNELEKGESEFKQMKHCTFKPRTNKIIKADINPQIDKVIKGIDAVKRRRDLIARKKREKEEREKEVFDFVSKYDTNEIHATHTIPQPFNLSKCPTKFHKHPIDPRDMFPFHPKTNYTEQKKRVEEILKVVEDNQQLQAIDQEDQGSGLEASEQVHEVDFVPHSSHSSNNPNY